MGTFETIGTVVAKASVAVANAIGVDALFSHRGAEPVQIKIQILKSQVAAVVDGGIARRESVLTVKIASGQHTLIKPDTSEKIPIQPGDVLRINGVEYSILDPVDGNRYQSVFTMKCIRQRRTHSGVA